MDNNTLLDDNTEFYKEMEKRHIALNEKLDRMLENDKKSIAEIQSKLAKIAMETGYKI
jgi:hypothetical protein